MNNLPQRARQHADRAKEAGQSELARFLYEVAEMEGQADDRSPASELQPEVNSEAVGGRGTGVPLVRQMGAHLGELLDKDHARLALFQAIGNIKIGNPTDDKLILHELAELGFWIARVAEMDSAGGDVEAGYWQDTDGRRFYPDAANYWVCRETGERKYLYGVEDGIAFGRALATRPQAGVEAGLIADLRETASCMAAGFQVNTPNLLRKAADALAALQGPEA